VLGMSIKDPGFRGYVKSLIPSRQVMREMFKYFGYGLYVGRV
jgi:hypothetical protein